MAGIFCSTARSISCEISRSDWSSDVCSSDLYGNLIKLSSLGYLEGYYYKPRVDWELLERHRGGDRKSVV